MSKKSKPKHASAVPQAKESATAHVTKIAPLPTPDPAATPKNLYMRHDPFFTLLGQF
jgi:hypothetical protein